MSGKVGDEVQAGIDELLPVLRDRAQEAEDRRVISSESIKSLEETGFFRLLQPKSFGGFEADPITFYSAVRKIASACGSTGWVSSVVGVHPWQLGLFAPQAQQDVWGYDINTRMSSSYAPTGKATPVEGGFQLSGRWSFSSGCDHATWVLLGGMVWGPDGKPQDYRTFLVPRSEYEIIDVWDTVGLRGTGSNDIVVKGTFVPEYRALSAMDTAKCVCPGHEINQAPLYKLPWGSIFPYAITAPIIGMATGAYDAHVAGQKERVRVAYMGQKSAEDPFAQVRVGEASSEIDAAWAQLDVNMRDLMAHANADEKIPMSLRLRIRRDQVKATGRSIGAVDRLFEAAGGRAIYMGTPLQRFWRDAHAGRAHAINDPERALSMFGQGEFGVPFTDAWV